MPLLRQTSARVRRWSKWSVGLLLPALMSTLLPGGAGAAWAESNGGGGGCTTALGHGRVQAWSGAGSNWGTAAQSWVWTYYDVTSFITDFTAEAAWMIDNNNWNDALEVGIGAGASANGGMSYYITPYYTTNNGTETDFWNDFFSTPSAPVTIMAYMTSSGLNAAAGSYKLMTNSSYSVSTPRLNLVQGETGSYSKTFTATSPYNGQPGTYHDSMAGGGSWFYGYYLPAGNSPTQWSPWGSINGTCSDDPSIYGASAYSSNYFLMSGGFPAN